MDGLALPARCMGSESSSGSGGAAMATTVAIPAVRRDDAFWWMHAKVRGWLIFAFLPFVGEPLILHRRFPGWAARRPDIAFTWLHRAHVV
jgi:hypothetical protein